jgi:integrase/recombinase XerD
MKCTIHNQVVLSRAPEGPLAARIGSFAESVSKQGYGSASMHRQVLLAACFSRWLQQNGVRLRSLCSDHAARYLRYRARRVRPSRGDAAALKHLIGFLRDEGVIPREKKLACQPTPAEHCAQAFGQYLLEVRALARPTIVLYVPYIRSFLKNSFGSARVTLSRLRASDVVRFVQRQAPRLHRKTAKNMTTALRSFLQYARYIGEVTLDLAAAVPIVANWSMTSIPRAISADHVRQLLASINRRTAVGRRDYAILLMLARLGLRAGEVVSLELGDIDWNLGQVNVRGKSGQRNRLPLPTEAGKAIAAYLRRGRINRSTCSGTHSWHPDVSQVSSKLATLANRQSANSAVP